MSSKVRRELEDLDAAAGKLGVDFDNADCLLIPEVKVLLETQKRRRVQAGMERPTNEVFDKTLDYCSKFSAFSNANTVRHIKSTVDQTTYRPFEIGLLGNLGIESVEEARSLIPR
ncbi:HRDC-like protein [Phlyctochytrium arcticum]|nr:HRDC-like protein [Phlyctochytrium arcticum]